MDPLSILAIVQAGIQLGQLAGKLLQEGRSGATPEEIEAALASVKVRQKAEEADWDAPINPSGTNTPPALSL